MQKEQAHSPGREQGGAEVEVASASLILCSHPSAQEKQT